MIILRRIKTLVRRVFYETLLKQIPTSEMAQDWCLAYGTLEHDEATKLYEIVCKRKGKPIPTGKVQPSPLKKAPSSSNLKAATHKSIKAESVLISKSNPKASSSVSNKAISQKKARIIDDNQVETGFETSSSWEAVGSVGI